MRYIKYHTIRKVSWDAMWHAVFTDAFNKENWDRVTESEALKISKNLTYK